MPRPIRSTRLLNLLPMLAGAWGAVIMILALLTAK
jgi:hypothetical protein